MARLTAAEWRAVHYALTTALGSSNVGLGDDELAALESAHAKAQDRVDALDRLAAEAAR